MPEVREGIDLGIGHGELRIAERRRGAILPGSGAGEPVSEGILLVLTTCADAQAAAALAESLVEQRLAACVNAIEGVTSTYRWQGKICEDSEFMLIVKTVAREYEHVERRGVARIHDSTGVRGHVRVSQRVGCAPPRELHRPRAELPRP